eukprot:TRINITY_DN8969_c0_g1_i1.p1 TRINITY_DN8969_c0_g1~~TRINITY_DN8969_c0_g1_i1.p1  ORF type:complete len:214 (+),score=41.99 TRINITY_DN8969_c0_g1_i1:169-810(+)
MRSHTGEKPFCCHVCDKGFPDKSSLAKHEKLHTNIREFICTTCGKAFSRKGNLKYHEKIHLGENPYAKYQKNYKNQANGNSGDFFENLLALREDNVRASDERGAAVNMEDFLNVEMNNAASTGDQDQTADNRNEYEDFPYYYENQQHEENNFDPTNNPETGEDISRENGNNSHSENEALGESIEIVQTMLEELITFSVAYAELMPQHIRESDF